MTDKRLTNLNKDTLLAEKATNIVSLITYMAHEVNNYMAKIVLEQNRGYEYYNKVEIESKKLKVRFFLYSSKTHTTGMIEYGFREFAILCSDKEHMLKTFDKLTIRLLDNIDSCSTNSILGMEGEL